MLPRMRRKIEIKGKGFLIVSARKRDIKSIQKLYNDVYEGKFTLPEIIERRQMEKIMYDENHIWVVAVHESEICASYIFSIDLDKNIGKLYAAVVDPNFRGMDLMVNMIKTTKKFMEQNDVFLDTVYATFRTVSLAPRKVLTELGFKSLGVFPNVHRVDEEETHGLQVWLSENSKKIRKKPPFLIPEMQPVYEIVRDILDLEEPVICHKGESNRLKFDKIYHGEVVKMMYKKARKKSSLILDFFPFHLPNYCFESKSEKTRVYVYSESKDGHSCILGIKMGKRKELIDILRSTIHTAESLRMDYIELLVSAYNTVHQQAAVDSGFLPCAYYPGFSIEKDERIDYIVCAYSSRDLDFSNVRLFETDRKFIDAYLSNTKYKKILPRVYKERVKR